MIRFNFLILVLTAVTVSVAQAQTAQEDLERADARVSLVWNELYPLKVEFEALLGKLQQAQIAEERARADYQNSWNPFASDSQLRAAEEYVAELVRKRSELEQKLVEVEAQYDAASDAHVDALNARNRDDRAQNQKDEDVRVAAAEQENQNFTDGGRRGENEIEDNILGLDYCPDCSDSGEDPFSFGEVVGNLNAIADAEADARLEESKRNSDRSEVVEGEGLIGKLAASQRQLQELQAELDQASASGSNSDTVADLEAQIDAKQADVNNQVSAINDAFQEFENPSPPSDDGASAAQEFGDFVGMGGYTLHPEEEGASSAEDSASEAGEGGNEGVVDIDHGSTANFPDKFPTNAVDESPTNFVGGAAADSSGEQTDENDGQVASDNTDQVANGGGDASEDEEYDNSELAGLFEALIDDFETNGTEGYASGSTSSTSTEGELTEEELNSLGDQFSVPIDPNDIGFGPTYPSPPVDGHFGGGDIFTGNVIDGVNANGGGFSGGPSGVGATQAERGGAVNSEHASSMAGIDAQGSNTRVALNTAARDHETAERAAAQNRQRSAEVANAVTGAVTAGLAQGAAQLGGRVGTALGEQVIYEPHRDDGCGGGGCGGGANGGGSGGSSGTTTREREQTGGTAVATGGNTGGSGDACSRAKILVQETEQLKARLQSGDSSAQARYNAAAIESIQASNACVAIRDQQRAEEQQQTAQTQPTGGTAGGGSSTSGGSSSGQTAGSGSSGSGVGSGITVNASRSNMSGSSGSSANTGKCDSLSRQRTMVIDRIAGLGTKTSTGGVRYTAAQAAQKRDFERQAGSFAQQMSDAGCF
jgi:hypothetical protein